VTASIVFAVAGGAVGKEIIRHWLLGNSKLEAR
jgi:hypothetical protein